MAQGRHLRVFTWVNHPLVVEVSDQGMTLRKPIGAGGADGVHLVVPVPGGHAVSTLDADSGQDAAHEAQPQPSPQELCDLHLLGQPWPKLKCGSLKGCLPSGSMALPGGESSEEHCQGVSVVPHVPGTFSTMRVPLTVPSGSLGDFAIRWL